MPRAIWKGSIAFGLVQIPVSLKPAEEPDELSFDMLDRRDLSPIGYERVNKRTGRKVEWKDIVKGYEYRKGKHVVVTDKDFERANVEATHTIDIEQVVDAASVDLRYYERPYYVFPDKAGEKGYVLLRDTLQRANKAALGRVVIRTRQHLVMLVPQGELLLLLLLRFDHELRKPEKLGLPKKLGVTAKEREMAETLVESLAGEWHPERYKDTFRNDLLRLIKAKVKRHGKELPEPEAAEPEPRGQILDLVELLKQSVNKKKGKPPRKTTGQRKKRKAA